VTFEPSPSATHYLVHGPQRQEKHARDRNQFARCYQLIAQRRAWMRFDLVRPSWSSMRIVRCHCTRPTVAEAAEIL